MSAPVRYLVELERPYGGWQHLQALTARARAAADQLRGEGMPVRFLRSIFVPEDEACFFLYEGESRRAVLEAVGRAEVALEQLVTTLSADGSEEASR